MELQKALQCVLPTSLTKIRRVRRLTSRLIEVWSDPYSTWLLVGLILCLVYPYVLDFNIFLKSHTCLSSNEFFNIWSVLGVGIGSGSDLLSNLIGYNFYNPIGFDSDRIGLGSIRIIRSDCTVLKKNRKWKIKTQFPNPNFQMTKPHTTVARPWWANPRPQTTTHLWATT